MKKMVLHRDMSSYLPRLEMLVPGWEVVFSPKDASAVRGAEVLAGWHADWAEYAFAEDSPLRWVQAWSAGVDSLPLDEFQKRGILLTTGSGVHAKPVSETLFAMILALARALPRILANQREGKWLSPWQDDDRFGITEIHNRTLGILGVGAIGSEVARLARGFSMHTLGLRHTGEPAPYVDEMYQSRDLNKLLHQCDYVVNLLPLTPETDKVMNADAFAAMRRGSRYFSLGRGPTTDLDALAEALRSGHLAGAGLDVTDPEPLPEDSPLWKMDNVIITPHIGGLTPSYDDRTMELFLHNLSDYLATGTPGRNLVDYYRSY
ncbi:MAG: D-2-hydroxyacid dehydrogenase [Oscillospiraceae bacterium]